MADIKKLVEEIKSMTVLEVSELVKELEETFGVSAAAPVAVAAVPTAGAAAPAAEEKTEFDVKALVESAPKVIKEAVPTNEAKEIEAKLKEAGATVKLK